MELVVKHEIKLNASVGDVISLKHVGMDFREEYFIVQVKGRIHGVEFSGFGSLLKSDGFDSVEELIDGIRGESLIENIVVLSQEDYKLTLEKK